ncbi:MAG: energy transducer TonB [bacterium]|nr:energy transducer TonB [bacterium]
MKLLLLLLFIPFLSLSQEDTTIVDFPDVEAEYPGGTAEMVKFIYENIEFPDSAYEYPRSRTYVTFVVEKDGSLTNIQCSNGTKLGKAFEDVIRIMPNWKPAKLNGTEVRSRCRVPLNINLK